MMNPESPFYWFDERSPGWLVTRERLQGLPVRPADVNRILDVNPEAATDPVMRRYLARLAAGDLRPRKGRPRARRLIRILAADILVDERAREIWAERKANSTRARDDLTPKQQAAEELARAWKSSGLSLLNAISAQRKKSPAFM